MDAPFRKSTQSLQPLICSLMWRCLDDTRMNFYMHEGGLTRKMDRLLLPQAFSDDPVLAYACLLTLLSLFVLLIPVPTWQAQDLPPVKYEVNVPGELRATFRSEISNKPEIRDGKIYPRCPADGRILSASPIIPATPEQIDEAILRAAAAQIAWARTSFAQRRRFLSTLLNHINAHQEEIVAACCLDSGKTKIDACFGEILVSVEKLQWTIKHGEKALSPTQRPTNLLMCYKKNTVIYEPLGVTAACFSWNYPFHFVISNVTSALFAGNSIVLKPSEQTCWSSKYFLDIVRGALIACGHSPELIQNVICLPDTAEYLTSHSGLSHITFIGSKEVAYKVCASAAKALTPVCVELGGKDPAIVLDDPKAIKSINDSAAVIMRGVFQSAGQNCIGIERVIALPKIHDKLLNILAPLIQNLRMGSILLESESPPDMGSMISSASFTRLETLISSAVSDGAILHCGGKRLSHPKYPDGTYFTPTLLSNVTPSMAIAQTELFAPVLLLMRAETVDEAISIANNTSYALGASVFGNPSLPSTQKCVHRIRAGMVSVNDFGAYYACSMPFGGAKGSGYGRFGGEEGLRSLCNTKNICEDWGVADWLGIRTRIPDLLQYPITDGGRGWEVCKGIIETGYAVGLKGRLVGIRKLLGGLINVGQGGKVEKSRRSSSVNRTMKTAIVT